MTLLHNEMIGEPPHSITLEIDQLFSYHQYINVTAVHHEYDIPWEGRCLEDQNEEKNSIDR